MDNMGQCKNFILRNLQISRLNRDMKKLIYDKLQNSLCMKRIRKIALITSPHTLKPVSKGCDENVSAFFREMLSQTPFRKGLYLAKSSNVEAHEMIL